MYRFFVDLIEPISLGYLVALGLVVRLWWTGRASRRVVALLGVVLLLAALSATELVGGLAIGTLESRYPPGAQPPEAEIDAIVVLGAGVQVVPAVDGGEMVELDEGSLYRCVHAAEVYRQLGPLPVVLSGGKASASLTGPSVARAMGDFLVGLGVAQEDIVAEEESRTTYENAKYSAALIRQRDWQRIVLVTDASHMYRAMACFRKMGVQAVASPCHYRATRMVWRPSLLIPSTRGAENFYHAFHEWMGVVWYWWKGRI